MANIRDFSKLRIGIDPGSSDYGKIKYFIYQQDGSKQWMECRDTLSNRLFISWMQIHDAPPARREASLS